MSSMIELQDNEIGLILYALRLAKAAEDDMRGLETNWPIPEEFVDGIVDEQDRKKLFDGVDALCQRINLGP